MNSFATFALLSPGDAKLKPPPQSTGPSLVKALSQEGDWARKTYKRLLLRPNGLTTYSGGTMFAVRYGGRPAGRPAIAVDRDEARGFRTPAAGEPDLQGRLGGAERRCAITQKSVRFSGRPAQIAGPPPCGHGPR
ncbi:hypothetical protein GUJ93_ZPchr0006g45870 [Zizania palustris]|uniref:Uncharacterized protein n=1 Tax=Zizania palustris TaxID=103762 RepID=A0A8J5TCT4_ZIZPA|nr:hypothetical protein GUJ93_ZPchr0006g45870 [Zizania palustris]